MILGQRDSLIVVLVQILFFFLLLFFFFFFIFCVFVILKEKGGRVWVDVQKIFDFLFTSKFISFFVLKKEEQVYVCGDFSVLFACNIKDGVTLAICHTALLKMNWQNHNLNDILLGLVVVLVVMISFLVYVVIVAVVMGLPWGVRDMRNLLIVPILSIIVQVNLVVVVVVAVMSSQLRIVWLVIFVIVVLSFK